MINTGFVLSVEIKDSRIFETYAEYKDGHLIKEDGSMSDILTADALQKRFTDTKKSVVAYEL